MAKVSILLSTYNSEKFLREQLDSLLAQTYSDWLLKIRDDGSSDATLNLIASYREPRFQLLEVGPNVNSVLSFSRLLALDRDSDYFFFCDHDDIWHKDKVEKQLAQLKQLEHQHGSSTPILVHSNLKIIDEQGGAIADSMWQFGRFFPERKQLEQLIVQGTVTGCVMAGNRALREKMSPVPEQALMHDWWASLVASQFGVIFSDPVARIDYRLHGNNQIGTEKPSIRQLHNRIFRPQKFLKFFYGSFEQAQAFLERYRKDLPQPILTNLQTYCQLLTMNRCPRVCSAWQKGFIRSTLYRNLYYYLILFLQKKQSCQKNEL